MNKEDKAYQDGIEDAQAMDKAKEDLRHAHEWLDDRGVPRSKGDDDYTILSRMQILYSCEVE